MDQSIKWVCVGDSYEATINGYVVEVSVSDTSGYWTVSDTNGIEIDSDSHDNAELAWLDAEEAIACFKGSCDRCALVA